MLFGFEASSGETDPTSQAQPEIVEAQPEIEQPNPDLEQLQPEIEQPNPVPKTNPEDDAVGTSSTFEIPALDLELFDEPKSAPTNERVELPADRPDPPGSALCDATRWRRFVHQFGQQEKMGALSAPLAMAGFVGTEGQTISIGFLSSLPLRQMEEVAVSADLQSALHASFGEGTRLIWSFDRDGKSGRSLIEELRLQRAERRAELEERATGNAAVARVQDTFPGAQIADVFLPETLEITDVR
jgi:hypothetical protein